MIEGWIDCTIDSVDMGLNGHWIEWTLDGVDIGWNGHWMEWTLDGMDIGLYWKNISLKGQLIKYKINRIDDCKYGLCIEWMINWMDHFTYRWWIKWRMGWLANWMNGHQTERWMNRKGDWQDWQCIEWTMY